MAPITTYKNHTI